MPHEELSGSAIIRAIKQCGIGTIVSVPDIHTSEGLLYPISKDPALRLLRVCREDEAIGIMAGLDCCSVRSLLLMQYTGLLDSINAIRGVAVQYKLPICMMVGLLNKEPGVPPTQSKLYDIRIIEPILDAMGIAHATLETDADLPKIPSTIARAYEMSAPSVLLVGRKPIAQ
jgi:sulfopyruvate decarboxylase subunit alpha